MSQELVMVEDNPHTTIHQEGLKPAANRRHLIYTLPLGNRAVANFEVVNLGYRNADLYQREGEANRSIRNKPRQPVPKSVSP